MGRVFTRRLVLTVPVRIADGGGGSRRTWEERGGFWAEVRMRSGSLRHSEFGRTARLQVRITTHALPQGHGMRPEPGDRVRDGARAFEVQAVHEARHELVILAGEVPTAEVEA